MDSSVPTAPEFRDKDFLKAFEMVTKKTLSDLGESVQTAVLYHIKKIEGLDSTELFKDPLRFVKALRQIFSTGSSVIEDKIIESMCSLFGIPYPDIAESFDRKIASIYASAFSGKNDANQPHEDLMPFIFNP